MSTSNVRPLESEDKERWSELYAAYARFYNSTQNGEMREQVWTWLMDDANELKGLVALDKKGNVVGIAHYRPFLRPLAASKGAFLDDLFVDPSHRGTGAAEALIGEIKAVAEKNGWSIVRWVTADNNYRARAVYDRLARKTDWLTYDIQL
ncbi:acetyltransferase (GNAT) family protein [Maritalea mobilis]|uniref:Acetyltransferase (GNAT) family protein n=1 Tax=Maritalea mobilis TaxID=483324 RepID=A0A4R6VN77_9HYPH|nr:GNAT family N-acetyltransferase [Maritalea mobilis]TDQ63652.1 acetyltransferase (GNAT) family protein [Maritalea mobilis]